MGNGITLSLDEVALPLMAHVHWLEVFLDPALLLGIQVAVAARSTYHELRVVCHLHPFWVERDLATVTLVLVSHCQLLQCTQQGAAPEIEYRSFQLVQNNAVCDVF